MFGRDSGMSFLPDWSKVIKETGRQRDIERKKWQEQLGEPFEVFEGEDLYVEGMWKAEDGVLVARITKQGADPASARILTEEYIKMLLETLES